MKPVLRPLTNCSLHSSTCTPLGFGAGGDFGRGASGMELRSARASGEYYDFFLWI